MPATNDQHKQQWRIYRGGQAIYLFSRSSLHRESLPCLSNSSIDYNYQLSLFLIIAIWVHWNWQAISARAGPTNCNDGRVLNNPLNICRLFKIGSWEIPAIYSLCQIVCTPRGFQHTWVMFPVMADFCHRDGGSGASTAEKGEICRSGDTSEMLHESIKSSSCTASCIITWAGISFYTECCYLWVKNSSIAECVVGQDVCPVVDLLQS